jgi:hypothetical protein
MVVVAPEFWWCLSRKHGNSVGSCWIVLPMFKQHIQKMRKHVPECRPNNAIIPNLILPQLVWWEKNMQSHDWCILDIYESLLRFQTSGTRCRSCSLKIKGGWLVVLPQERSCGCSQHHWHPYAGHSNAWRDPSTWRHSPTRGRSVGTSVWDCSRSVPKSPDSPWQKGPIYGVNMDKDLEVPEWQTQVAKCF